MSRSALGQLFKNNCDFFPVIFRYNTQCFNTCLSRSVCKAITLCLPNSSEYMVHKSKKCKSL